MAKMTVAALRKGLTAHDNGVLSYGGHEAGARAFCALEYRSVLLGQQFTDDPDMVDFPDIRSLNDAFGKGPDADTHRTKHLLPVLAALWNWHEWSQTKRIKWAKRVAIYTVNDIVSALPGLTPRIRLQCQHANTVRAAKSAARSAARSAADSAADSAAASAKVKVLARSCRLFIQATQGL